MIQLNNFRSFKLVLRLTCLASIALSVDFVAAQVTSNDFSPGTQKPGERPVIAREKPQTGFNSLPFQSSSKKTADPVQQKFSDKSLTQPTQTIPSKTWAKPTSFGTTETKPAPRKTVAQTSQSLPSSIKVSSCKVKFIDDIKLPAREAGVIEMLTVKEGQRISAGQLIGKINDEIPSMFLKKAEHRFNMAQDKVKNNIPLRAATRKLQVATIEANKTRTLANKGAKSDAERLSAEYSMDIAALEKQNAMKDTEVAKDEAVFELLQIQEIQQQIKRHALISNFDGYVVKIFKKPQEFVNVGDDVVRIARMDKLWVEGNIEINKVNPHEVTNRPVTVTIQLARGATETFQGRIVNVGLERQSGTSYNVKAEVTNRPIGDHWLLQPLSTVSMEIHLGQAPANQSFESAARSVGNQNK